MNQILSFQTAEDSRKHLKKVIKIFSIFLIIFGIIFIVEGILGYQKLKNRDVKVEAPDISIERANETTLLHISSNKRMSEVKYYWNIMSEGIKGNVVEERINGKTDATVEVPTLNGTNELIIEILDVDGNIIKYNPILVSYDYENLDEKAWQTAVNSDKTKPTIKLEGSNGKVIIRADDNLKMSYITYSWNNGQEVTVSGLTNEEKTVKEEIDVQEGNNKLTVKAYDRAGNVETVEREIQGVKGPNIKVFKENGQIIIKIDDEDKITKVQYNFNGTEKTIDNINEKNYELKLDLVDGENYIILDAYRNDIKSSYKGKTKK